MEFLSIWLKRQATSCLKKFAQNRSLICRSAIVCRKFVQNKDFVECFHDFLRQRQYELFALSSESIGPDHTWYYKTLEKVLETLITLYCISLGFFSFFSFFWKVRKNEWELIIKNNILSCLSHLKAFIYLYFIVRATVVGFIFEQDLNKSPLFQVNTGIFL